MSTTEMSENQSIQHQLDEWLAGRPWHNPVREECCPDFSCCGGDIASLEVRQRFIKAVEENDEQARMGLLGMFLGAVIEKQYGPKHKIAVTGDSPLGAEQ